MFSSSTPCIVRIGNHTWRCSQCNAIFLANENSSTSNLLVALEDHVKREHRDSGKERPIRSRKRWLHRALRKARIGAQGQEK